MTTPDLMIDVRALHKQFLLHNQGGIRLPVLQAVGFQASAGDCLVLSGPSGAGKSTLLRCLYGNYLASGGSIRVRAADGQWTDLAEADEQQVLALRRGTIAYVSQFLRAIPRVPTLDVVAEPLRQLGEAAGPARERAAALLARLNVPERLWALSPATFSGGEQQRVNIARGFITAHPILLLDEPTASLDKANRQVVIEMIAEKKASGTALLGIFHDQEVREAVADHVVDVTEFAPKRAAA